MPVFPIITPSLPSVIITTGSGGVVTYNEINRSQAQFLFYVKKIYIKASNIYDMPTDIVVVRNTPDGKSLLIEENINVSPNQIQATYLLKPEIELIFDGYTSVSVNVAPNAKLQLLFDVQILRRADILAK